VEKEEQSPKRWFGFGKNTDLESPKEKTISSEEKKSPGFWNKWFKKEDNESKP
jgi:hypothetical protein